MEAVGVAASLLTLVGAVAQSTKSLYELVYGLRNSSQQIASLAAALHDLQLVLSQLQNEQALQDPNADLQTVSTVVAACETDLIRYRAYLDKVNNNSNNSKVKHTWKKIKVVLGEKEIDQIRMEIIRHYEVLGFQLNVLQAKTIRTSKDKLHDINNVVTTTAVRQSTFAQQQNSYLSNIASSIDGLKPFTADHIHNAVSSIKQTVQHSADLSESKDNHIFMLLETLQAKVDRLSTQMPHSSRTTFPNPLESPDLSSGMRTSDAQSDFIASLHRLAQLAAHDRKPLHDDEADIVIEDLTRLVDSIISSPTLEKGGSRKRKLSEQDGVDKDLSARELKRICGMILSSHVVDVNEKAPRTRSSSKGRILQKYRTKSIEAEEYLATISVHEKRLSKSSSTTSSHLNQNHDEIMDYTAKLRVSLKHPQQPVVLAIYLHHTRMLYGSLIRNPIISAGMSLPSDSLIFRIVESGDVEALQGLISRGECTLRERTLRGTPLLHFATEQPAMCRFLIENGADIDELAENWEDHNAICTPISASYFNDFEVEDTKLERAIECRRLLLRAGADPTIEGRYKDGEFPIALDEALETGTLESLQVLLDFGTPFINLGLHRGETPLTRLAQGCGYGYDVARFRVLLDRGANTSQRNDKGRNCLHIAVQNARTWKYRDDERTGVVNLRDFECLVLLISRGADVDAIDYNGMSVSDYAYQPESDWRDCGGYRGDLWDAVLTKCELDLRERRRSYPRKPQYTKWYTRETFEELWIGREKECPYFHDPSIWYANGDSQLWSAEEYGSGLVDSDAAEVTDKEKEESISESEASEVVPVIRSIEGAESPSNGGEMNAEYDLDDILDDYTSW